VASFLKGQGYRTAIIGKWHLNFQYTDAATGEILSRTNHKNGAPVGSKIPDGPTARGFDYFHGFHHARDMKVVIENDAVIKHDDVENMLPRLATKSAEFIDQQATQNPTQPSFSMCHSAHRTPLLFQPANGKEKAA